MLSTIMAPWSIWFLPCCALGLFACAGVGILTRRMRPGLVRVEQDSHITALEASVLGMLALMLGFSVSMAVGRFDSRRQLEIDEANAIGTTWLRTQTLPGDAGARSRLLLLQYVRVRMEFVSAGDDQQKINASLQQAGTLQTQLWKIASEVASEHRDPVSGLYLATLNDSIDLSEKRTAAFENRIPTAVWIMLFFLSAVAAFLSGFSMPRRSVAILLISPLIVACALSLILDLDSPRSGLIRIPQTSMERLQQQLQTP